MISYIRFFVYLAFLAIMIILGINNQQLRANVKILNANCENYQKVLEIKNVMMNTLERNLHSVEKLSAEREEKIETMELKLNKARVLLEAVDDETIMPDTAIELLRSIGIVRKDGNESGSSDGVQSDVTTGAMDAEKGSSDTQGQEVQRPAEMEY